MNTALITFLVAMFIIPAALASAQFSVVITNDLKYPVYLYGLNHQWSHVYSGANPVYWTTSEIEPGQSVTFDSSTPKSAGWEGIVFGFESKYVKWDGHYNGSCITRFKDAAYSMDHPYKSLIHLNLSQAQRFASCTSPTPKYDSIMLPHPK